MENPMYCENIDNVDQQQLSDLTYDMPNESNNRGHRNVDDVELQHLTSVGNTAVTKPPEIIQDPKGGKEPCV